MKTFMILICLSFVATACMKSKEEYRHAIEDIQMEEAAPAEQNPERSRGSNDREGMGDVTE
ncbi:MAG: hypothetical protein V4598_04105 [Bdellovibrionota bacterium]